MIGVDERIGFGPRFIASLIDVVIFVVLSFALGMVAGTFLGALVVGATSRSGMGMLGAMAGFMVAFTIVGVLYPLIEGITGWSPGKRLRGLLIGTADGDVAPLRTIRAAPLGKRALAIGNPGAVGYDSKRDEILVPN